MDKISVLNPGELNCNQVQSQSSSDNREDVVNTTSNVESNSRYLTSVPQVGVDEQLVNGKSVDDQVQSQSSSDNSAEKTDEMVDKPDYLDSEPNIDGKENVVVDNPRESPISTWLNRFGDKVSIRNKVEIDSYQQAKKLGCFVPLVVKGNRKVYRTQVKALAKSVKSTKKFSQSCIVVPARLILEKYPDVELVDLDGNLVTLEDPRIDNCFVLYDGQHRIAVCECDPNVDVSIEIEEFNGQNPIDCIKTMNSFSRNWSCVDLRDSNEEAGIAKSPLYEESNKLQNLYGITPKLSEYTLTFEREATKKKDLVAGISNTLYNEYNCRRGSSIYHSAMTNFDSPKELKKLEFMDAIVTKYKCGVLDENKGVFARNMKLCLGLMSLEKRNSVLHYIQNKDFGLLNTIINNEYDDFCSAGHSDERLAEMEEALDKRIEAYLTNLDASVKAVAAQKPMKSGYVYEFIKHEKSLSKVKTK